MHRQNISLRLSSFVWLNFPSIPTGTLHDPVFKSTRRQIRLPQPAVHFDVARLAQLSERHFRRQGKYDGIILSNKPLTANLSFFLFPGTHPWTVLPARNVCKCQQISNGPNRRKRNRFRRHSASLGKQSWRVYTHTSHGMNWFSIQFQLNFIT